MKVNGRIIISVGAIIGLFIAGKAFNKQIEEDLARDAWEVMYFANPFDKESGFSIALHKVEFKDYLDFYDEQGRLLAYYYRNQGYQTIVIRNQYTDVFTPYVIEEGEGGKDLLDNGELVGMYRNVDGVDYFGVVGATEVK